MALLEIENLTVRFQTATGLFTAVDQFSAAIEPGEVVAIVGESGSGKSTLLKLLYLGEPVTEGQVLVEGMNLSRIPRRRIPYLRRKFGIIFQDYKLIPTKSVYDNVALVLEAAGAKKRMIQKKVKSVLRLVGMEDRLKALPPSLSGGEQQRVAIARAIAKNPDVLLCDEPTGALDSSTGVVVLEALQQVNQKLGTTTAVITHNASIGQMADRVIHLADGRISEVQVNASKVAPRELSW